jgi:hypothetical protein
MSDSTHPDFLRWIESLRDGLSEYLMTHPLLYDREGRDEVKPNTYQRLEIISQNHEL